MNANLLARNAVEGRRPPLVGLTGRIGSGKSFAAALMRERHGFTIHSFAYPLKAMLMTLGLDEDQVNGARRSEPCDLLCGKTPRHAMQTIGTEWGRDLIGADLWVNAWKVGLPAGPVVADDVRFANEARAVRSLGGVVIRVIDIYDALEEDELHASEQLDFAPDVTLFNNKDAAFASVLDMALIRFLGLS